MGSKENSIYDEITCRRSDKTTSQSLEFILLVNANYISALSPYRAVNTLRLVYKNQSVNAV